MNPEELELQEAQIQGAAFLPTNSEHRSAGTRFVVINDFHLSIHESGALESGHGGLIWTSSIYLASHLISLMDVRGKKVLELGCGCGLAGVALAKAGAIVHLTDYNTEVLENARNNAHLNGVDVDTFIVDWSQPLATVERYDLVMGADVVYFPPIVPLLVEVIHSLVSKGADYYGVSPSNRAGYLLFFHHATARGLKVETQLLPCDPSIEDPSRQEYYLVRCSNPPHPCHT